MERPEQLPCCYLLRMTAFDINTLKPKLSCC